jgi:uncharacterized protein YkwD
LPGAINWARLHGCARGDRPALRENPKLRQAAQELARGASLKAALASVGYPANESSAVFLSGAGSDSAVGTVLASHDCPALIDPDIREMGAQRRGGDVWIVLAAPALLPAAGDSVLIRSQILELVNQARATGRRCGGKTYPSAAPLTLSVPLNSAALAHSRQMAAYQEFDHRGHDGSSPSVRVQSAGYGPYTLVGENIAAGAMTPLEVTEGWLASPAHCENIMDPRFGEIGIGYAVNPRSAELVYWTQDFAAPRRVRSAAGVLSPGR